MTSIDVGCTCWFIIEFVFERWCSMIWVSDTYQHETRRKQQHIDRPETFHVSLGLLTSLLTCPPSELYDIRHQSQRNRDLNSVKKIYQRMRHVARSDRKHRSYEYGPTSATNHCWNSWYLFRFLFECVWLFIYFEKSRTYQRANRDAESGIGGGLIVIRYSCCDWKCGHFLIISVKTILIIHNL